MRIPFLSPRPRRVAVIRLQGVIGIAGRVGFTTIYIEKALMNQQRGFVRRMLEVLEPHDV